MLLDLEIVYYVEYVSLLGRTYRTCRAMIGFLFILCVYLRLSSVHNCIFVYNNFVSFGKINIENRSNDKTRIKYDDIDA